MFDHLQQPAPAFDARSRYGALAGEPAVYTDERGRQIPYLRRRFLPQGRKMPQLAEVRPNPGDRIDLLAARTIGDPLQFWRICDANDTMNPFDLLAESGTLRV